MGEDETTVLVDVLRSMVTAYAVDIFPDPAPEDRPKDGRAAWVLRTAATPHFNAAADTIERLTAERDALIATTERLTAERDLLRRWLDEQLEPWRDSDG